MGADMTVFWWREINSDQIGFWWKYTHLVLATSPKTTSSIYHTIGNGEKGPGESGIVGIEVVDAHLDNPTSNPSQNGDVSVANSKVIEIGTLWLVVRLRWRLGIGGEGRKRSNRGGEKFWSHFEASLMWIVGSNIPTLWSSDIL